MSSSHLSLNLFRLPTCLNLSHLFLPVGSLPVRFIFTFPLSLHLSAVVHLPCSQSFPSTHLSFPLPLNPSCSVFISSTFSLLIRCHPHVVILSRPSILYPSFFVVLYFFFFFSFCFPSSILIPTSFPVFYLFFILTFSFFSFSFIFLGHWFIFPTFFPV